MKFVAGQRVRYVGKHPRTFSPQCVGELATVLEQNDAMSIWIRFDTDGLNRFWRNQRAFGVLPENIELIDEIFKYDPKQAGDQDDDI